MSDDLATIREMINESVIYGIQNMEPRLTAKILDDHSKAGTLTMFFEALISATREAVGWGQLAISPASQVTSAELDAIAFTAVLDAIGTIVPPEGVIGIVQGTIAKWFDLSDYTDETIHAAIYETSREMGIPMRTAKSVKVLDDAKEIIGHFLKF